MLYGDTNILSYYLFAFAIFLYYLFLFVNIFNLLLKIIYPDHARHIYN